MARKGQPKVRSGCYTCKTRKVKCDEARPFCDRCTRTGRTCAGYANNPQADGLEMPSTGLLLQQQPRNFLAGSENPLEARSLHYFCVHAPYLVGGLDPYFWTNLSLQFSAFEPAVRHSLVAISSLYEQLHSGSRSIVSLRHNAFALTHYNAAIYGLKTTQNQPLVIVVCMLFICIEFMQYNAKAAIRHCRHGLALFNQLGTLHPWMMDRICPGFQRLSMIPLLFGGLYSPEVPSLPFHHPISLQGFTSISEARTSIDVILTRTLRLIHRSATHRLHASDADEHMAQELVAEQQEIQQTLTCWNQAFVAFEVDVNKYTQTVFRRYKMSHKDMYRALTLGLEVRYELCRILAATALSGDDTCYDDFLEDFQTMAMLSMTLLTSGSSESHQIQRRRPFHFIFESGFPLPMFFLVSKCRNLSVRRPALTCLRWLSLVQENLWRNSAAVSVAKRIVEHEHGVLLDDEFQVLNKPEHPDMAPVEARIQTHWLDLVALQLTDGVEQMNADELFGSQHHGSSTSSDTSPRTVDTSPSTTSTTKSQTPEGWVSGMA